MPSRRVFLALERTLTKRLNADWIRVSMPLIRRINRLVKQGKFDEAGRLVDKLDMTAVAKKNERLIRSIGFQAMMFGASDITPRVASTGFAQAPGEPPQLDRAVEIFMGILIQNGNEMIRKTAEELIAVEEKRQAEEVIIAKFVGYGQEKIRVKKAFGTAFVRSVTTAGNNMSQLASSLHASRLANWGFTVEAELRQITTYEISEQLDDRTCPICREMDGKRFEVAQTKATLESWLSQENPNDLKALAPWPKSTKDGVAGLKRMSNAELQGRGWATPPFHPLCRGILVESKGTITIPPIEQRPDLPEATFVDLEAATFQQVARKLPPVGLVNFLLGGSVTAESRLDKLTPKS